MRKLTKLCVVIPGLNEAENLPVLYAELLRTLGSREWALEILFVDDGSTDETLAACRDLNAKDPRFQFLSLSRNFGHQRALTAGLDAAEGDAVAVMDADLQDPPEVVLEMIALWETGVDVVYGQRRSREGETFFKIISAQLFYRVTRFLSDVKIPEDTGDFRLMDIRVVRELCRLREQGRFMRGLVTWVGFNQQPIYFDRKNRLKGTTKYPLFRMLRFAWDGITSFSGAPLRMATLTGAFFSLLAFLSALFYAYRKFVYDDMVHGWAGLMVTILAVGGAQILFIGVVGEYLSKVFDESKGRPLYIVRETSQKKP